MNKREFLKTSAMTAASTAIPSGLLAAGDGDIPRENWAGNYHYSTNKVLQPSTLAEAQDAVRSVSHVRALGTRHCFNGIADSTVAQISTLRLNSFRLNAAGKTVTVGAGIKYGDLAVQLDRAGFALHNMASLPHISVAGSIATATHGSGLRNGNLATAVNGLEMVTADGSVRAVTRAKDGERFLGSVVGLGALGIVTSVTLDVQPRYEMTQVVYRDLDFAQLEHNLEAIMGAGTAFRCSRTGRGSVRARSGLSAASIRAALQLRLQTFMAQLWPRRRCILFQGRTQQERRTR